MMQDYKRDILRTQRENIGKSISDIDSVVTKLTDYKVITRYTEEEILANRTSIQKCRELLNVLPKRGDTAFEMFYKVLIECEESTAAGYLQVKQEHRLPLVFPDPADDSKIVDVKKCIARNGDPVYEKYKGCMTDSEVYPMNSNPRGHCVVINNQKFDEGTKLDYRDGSEKDVDSLKKLFTQLHFLIEVKDNLTAKQIKDLVKDYKELDHSNYNCFVFVILSHGSHGSIYGKDGERVAIQEIVFSFDSIECQSLGGKPKLFFVQACQGDMKDWGTQNSQKLTQKDIDEIVDISNKLDDLHLHQTVDKVDANLYNTARGADMFIAMATSPGYVSWRNINIGTWFIQAVVYAFKYWAHSQELVNLMTKVNNLVQIAETRVDRNKQSPEWRSSLGKSLYFFPGLAQEVAQPIVSTNQMQPMDKSEKSATVVNPTGFLGTG